MIEYEAYTTTSHPSSTVYVMARGAWCEVLDALYEHVEYIHVHSINSPQELATAEGQATLINVNGLRFCHPCNWECMHYGYRVGVRLAA